jgi:hypothetical protein
MGDFHNKERFFSALPLYSVVIPAMNEEGNIEQLANKIVAVMEMKSRPSYNIREKRAG